MNRGALEAVWGGNISREGSLLCSFTSNVGAYPGCLGKLLTAPFSQRLKSRMEGRTNGYPRGMRWLSRYRHLLSSQMT